MVLNPRKIVDRKIISPVTEEQIQPNGIDLELDKIFSLITLSKALRPGERDVEEKQLGLFLSKDDVEGSFSNPVQPYDDKHFLLHKFIPYRVETKQYVELPEGVCAKIIGRSTLNRNGVIVLSSLYDSGYKNYAGFTIYPFLNVVLEVGVRVAQMIFFESETAHLYDGQYQDKKSS
jgi:dUTP pyrophosphatase